MSNEKKDNADFTDTEILDWLTKNPDDLFFNDGDEEPWDLGQAPQGHCFKTPRAAIVGAMLRERDK